MVDGKYMISEITFTPTVTLVNEAHGEKAVRLLHKAEAACLISNSLRSTILLEPIVNVVAVAM
jgi:organic hydroperoxide reductase OsmC/OhrA